MSVKSKLSTSYVGPKALFDPTYVPPKLLYREKEERLLSSVLNDSITDHYSLRILYQGIQGIGKKAIINRTLNDLSIQNKNIQKISVDCSEKGLEELVISLLTKINDISNLNIDFSAFINAKISDLWNILKVSCQKFNNNTIFILNNVEHLKPEIFKKFLNFGKESKISIISTVNKILRSSSFDILCEFDLKKKMEYFSYKELYNILKQRVNLAFSHEIDKELIEFLTDLIFEHYAPVPGKGIDVLRDLYPNLQNKMYIKYKDLLEICQNNFDLSPSSDEFSLLTYISEEDLLTIIFLDNLSSHFINKSKYYISLTELRNIYDLSCESLEFDKSGEEFKQLIKSLDRLGILSASKKKAFESSLIEKKDLLDGYRFFIVISPNQLKSMVDAVFGKL